jgi:hypothetical protein
LIDWLLLDECEDGKGARLFKRNSAPGQVSNVRMRNDGPSLEDRTFTRHSGAGAMALHTIVNCIPATADTVHVSRWNGLKAGMCWKRRIDWDAGVGILQNIAKHLSVFAQAQVARHIS